MNIKEAKEEIKNAMIAYFSKDKYGQYMIPTEKQRPVFLLGAPGIGKTAIMEQIAAELGVGLVSYSMTHHTRQSALGLPFIVQKDYDGKIYDVSEYTMSEIIASVYDMMKETGVKEGILFLDEINCVSETLSPSMLQFLQYKIFGKHKVPDGWIVVTAGNPPEYNNSVREFDIVTWDRLKRIDVEPDFAVWKEYAYQKRVHPAIITYLDIKKEDFYSIETTVDGIEFVTARGWSDLSDMLYLYEMNQLRVTERLIVQYIQSPSIAKRFSVYYDLFLKYKSDYQIETILNGTVEPAILERAKTAKFDERITLLGLVLDAVNEIMKDVILEEQMLKHLLTVSTRTVMLLQQNSANVIETLDGQIAEKTKHLETAKQSGAISGDILTVNLEVLVMLEDLKMKLVAQDVNMDNDTAIACIKEYANEKNAQLKANIMKTKQKLSNVFSFCEDAFEEGQELLVLVTELTVNAYSIQFISKYGCPEYFKHNKKMLLSERQKEIIQALDMM